ncbi:NADPH-dependent F420 reductase [Streptomyces hygroscopicus]|uniref:NADPH-dependent F420 reductase n=1 Tax=Streptomyces hygroscopicus TaxID=1912 RepID=UPI000825CF92|nr:NAD(P)-binding domain-containing protein [Streptomyces hygroscopicus]MBW8090923.1 NAD(P)-binding domain-containing protein [Streptomyces hygroscopicus subsp. hygroscopicus]
MTSIGILGTGRVGSGLARELAAAGHEVTLGHRRPPEEPAAPGTGPARGLRCADQRTAVATTDIVLNATPGDTTLERLSALGIELAGKILIDVSNATRHSPDGLPSDLCYPGSSLAEKLQRALPATRVVKTLNTMLFPVMTAPAALSTPPTAYLSGNDADAKNITAGLLGDLGWRPEWIEDLGDITTARATEALVLLVPHVLRRRGFQPFAVSLAR